MKKQISISAIGMFAVLLGMTAFAPAFAVPNQNSSADTVVCHYFVVYQTDPDTGEVITDPDTGEPLVDEEASGWGLLYVDNNGALNGHTKHHDMVWDPDAQTIDEFEAECIAQPAPTE